MRDLSWAAIRTWATRLWLLLLGVVVVWALASRSVSLPELLQRVSIVAALAALGLVVAGKLLVMLLVAQVLGIEGEGRGWRFAWRAYSLADLAKYLPGGIWGFASRLVIYRGAGIPMATGGGLLLRETVLLVAFSAGTGLAFLALAHASAPVGIAAAAAIVSGLVVTTRLVLRRSSWRAAGALVPPQIGAWVAFGLSFAVISDGGGDWGRLAGTFDVGFAAGMLAVFAPSGVGVREAVVGWLGGDFQRLVELAVIHRLLWIVADILVFLPVLFWRDPQR